MKPSLDDFQLFTGAATDASAQVYVRARNLPPQSGKSLVGRIHGPLSDFASTLPASFEVKDQGAGPHVLAKGSVADPCYWTPEVPFHYRIELAWRSAAGEESLGTHDFFLRRFGPRGKDLYLDGRRWVMRGVSKDFGRTETMATWREVAPICVAAGELPWSFLDRLARQGVMLVPWLRASDALQLPRLSSQSGIAMCVLEQASLWPADLRERMPQSVLLQHAHVGGAREAAPWAHGWAVSLDEDPAAIAAWREVGSPVVVCRRGKPGLSLAEARAECDRLQREVAPHGDWSGFVIL